jgi:chemotaxis protein MotA
MLFQSFLWQPYEVLIIMGAAFGAFLVANPMHVVKDTMRHGKYVFTGSGYNSELFMHQMTTSNPIIFDIKFVTPSCFHIAF